jgi:hypothetical protein
VNTASKIDALLMDKAKLAVHFKLVSRLACSKAVKVESIYCDHMTIARQRFGKHISEVTLSTVEEHPLLGSKSVGTFP